jgi:hypothetical protein
MQWRTMNTKFNIQKERLRKIKEEGAVRFIFKYGLGFALLIGFCIFFISKPPVPNLILAGLIIISGVFYGVGMWCFMMWQYKKYH